MMPSYMAQVRISSSPSLARESCFKRALDPLYLVSSTAFKEFGHPIIVGMAKDRVGRAMEDAREALLIILAGRGAVIPARHNAFVGPELARQIGLGHLALFGPFSDEVGPTRLLAFMDRGYHRAMLAPVSKAVVNELCKSSY